jgi:hypothetical protein
MEREPDYVTELRTRVDRACEELRAIPDSVAGARPAPDKWSVKEIIGHLIDSAANNHQRFVRARWQEDLVFPAYAQDEWVAAQDYRTAPWPELVTLWQSYNRHLARVMANVPPAVRTRLHQRHNLDQIAWRTIPADQPATLDYFMRDYVGHLEHHLKQIADLIPPLSRPAP